jgi:hypothetical protein
MHAWWNSGIEPVTLGSKASVLSTAPRRMAIKVSKARSSNKITLGKIKLE